jgi:hypothetical protein
VKAPTVDLAVVDDFAAYLADVWGARPLASESDLDPVLLRALRGDRLRFEREAESGGEDPVWREAIRRRYDRPIPEGEGAVAAALADSACAPRIATVARAGKVAKAVAGQDPDGLSSSVISEVEASLKAAGLSGAALAAALAAVEDALEDAVDGEADA